MRKTIKKNKQNPSKTKYRNIHMIGRPGAVKKCQQFGVYIQCNSNKKCQQVTLWILINLF